MIMNQKGRGNDNFETPDYIFKQLDEIFNFHFDVAASQYNAKCFNYFSEKSDALKNNWYGRCFCNPPFSKKLIL